MKWQDELKMNINTVEQLKQYVKLPPKEERKLQKVTERHPMRLTRYYARLVNWSDPNDPIKKMMVPSIEELVPMGHYDTSGEAENTKMPGLQHKYAQTPVILATNRCASYCRYCFRKRLVGLPTTEILKRFNEATRYIENCKEATNVLITGGDPFMLPTSVIRKFLEKLSTIPHLDFIRFGTKIPVSFPDRILQDKRLLTLLRKYSKRVKRIYVVTQFNHQNEITDKSAGAVDRLMEAGVITNNQTVLLRGVNDDPDAMAALQRRLVGIGANPYYVFQCRPVRRVKHHFQVPFHRGYRIIEEARKRLDGHSKRFKFIMSHRTGKVEIVGVKGDEIYLKYHQAKDPANLGRFFKRRLTETAGWLDDLR